MASYQDVMGGMPDPQTMTGVGGANLGRKAGVESPFFYDAMSSLPTASMTSAWNMRRVSNTIWKNKRTGGRALKLPGEGGRGLRQTFSPFRFNSLANVENIDPATAVVKAIKPGRLNRAGTATSISYDVEKTGYTPFNALARMGNAPFTGGTRSNRIAAKLGLQGPMNKITGRAEPLYGEKVFNPGTFGRLAAAGRAGGSRGVANMENILGSVGRLDGASEVAARRALRASASHMTSPLPGIMQANKGAGGYAGMVGEVAAPVGFDEGQILKSAIGRTNTGIVSGRVTGWIHGAEAVGRGEEAVNAARVVGTGAKHYAGGLEKGISFAENSGMIGKLAGSGILSGAARIAGPIGTAMMVRDITMFAGRTVGRGLKLGMEGLQSAQRDLIKPGPFGAGYKDNSVAATSRQRGVMAISNSRLNARSFLGSEAASMHQMFG